MRKGMAIAAAALLTPAAGGAHPTAEQIFCHQLKRVVEVAELGGDFTYLERSRAAPPTFGFRHGCRAHEASERLAAAWWCHQNLAPEHLSRDSLAALTAACLLEAVRSRSEHGRDVTFTVPRARIEISESGGPGAHVGRIVTFRIEAIPPAEEAPPSP